MAPLTAPPTIDVLSRAAWEEVGKKFAVKVRNDLTADLVAISGRVNIFLESSEEPVAVLRFGGPHSGALWMGGVLIGEFNQDPTGSFVVVEIEDGFKRPGRIRGKDPIAYLLDRLFPRFA